MTDEISILVPTYCRAKFLPLFLLNLKSQEYDHSKLTVVIYDDSPQRERFIQDSEIDEVRNIIAPMKLMYHVGEKRLSIGKKRDALIKMCKTKIFTFMDDDDIYLSTYISSNFKSLKSGKYGCVGSDKMIFCMTDKEYSVHAIDCGNTNHMIHEATIMATKKWYKASCGFADNSRGEGKTLFEGIRNVCITDIKDLMVCVQHSGNTVDKLQFANEENKINIEMSDEMINLLNTILKN